MNKKETHSFQSEIKQLLNLMINSLYSNKEIFLRELISNSSDAIDKLRFYALSKPELYEQDNELKIRIAVDKNNYTITVSDNGLGMNRDEIIKNLGTIAHSGTKAFLNDVNQEIDKNNKMIGQFGVGFYSSFIIADKVSVHTRSAGVKADQGVLWESTGQGEYSVSTLVKITRGTDIILHLRKNEKEFLNTWKLKNIIKKYSDHISIPIEIELYDEKNNVKSWEQVNKAEAIWMRNKSDIKEYEYKEFYKHITHDFNDPLLWSHNIVEGNQNYTCLLYIPSKTPFDLWNHNYKHGLKLYVQRVFIMDDAEQFLPNYLRFIRGIIDSNNLPLNISREILQDTNLTKNLRISLSKRVLGILEKTAKNDSDKYQQFWKQFGLVFKEGPAEDIDNIKTISKLLRFSSTMSSNNDQTVSLDMYVNRMSEKQEKIYYITADNYISAKNSPHLEIFLKKNIEVLLLSDRIDEWMMNYLTKFNGKNFQLVSKSDESLNKMIEEKEIDNVEEKELLHIFINKVKIILGEKVKDVRLTYRLNNTPTIVTTDASDLSTQMSKILTAAGQSVPTLKYLFEINPKHPIIKNILNIIKKERDINKNNFESDMLNDWIELLFSQALLAEKGTLDDNNRFIFLVNKLLTSSL